MRIDFYTNLVQEGWSAENLETGIGGSEEKLIELATELAKEHEVTIYHNGKHGVFDGVTYIDHREFKAWEYRDVFVSFKTRHILSQSINAGKVLHWTTEIEQPWSKRELEGIDKIITISKYHKRQMGFTDDKLIESYLWVDTDRLDKNKVTKVKGTMLYCSSFDRGLEELLNKWADVKKNLGIDKLYITYGWDFLDKVIKYQPHLLGWKNAMLELLKQDGIEMVGRVSNDEMCKYYWKSEYWVLPLNNPESELFCMNAIKAQYCGSIPVVRRIGALQETVNKYIDWDNLLGQKASQSEFDNKDVVLNVDHAKGFNLKVGVKEWTEKLLV